MANLYNPANIKKLLDAQTASINSNVDTKTTAVSSTVTTKAAETQTTVNNTVATKAAETQAALINDNDVTQAKLDSMTTVNGTLDNNVTAINDNTNAKHVTTDALITSEADRVLASIPPPASVIKSIQRGNSQFHNGSESVINVNISAVNLSKSFINFSTDIMTNSTSFLEAMVRGYIKDATTISFLRGSTLGNVFVNWEVVEYV